MALVGGCCDLITAGPAADKFISNAVLMNQVETITKFNPSHDKFVLSEMAQIPAAAEDTKPAA
jgi:hypothetical protein